MKKKDTLGRKLEDELRLIRQRIDDERDRAKKVKMIRAHRELSDMLI